jgi:hypothetical protein
MTGQQSNFFKFKLVFLSPWDGRSFFFEVFLFLDENVWPEGKLPVSRGCVQINFRLGRNGRDGV